MTLCPEPTNTWLYPCHLISCQHHWVLHFMFIKCIFSYFIDAPNTKTGVMMPILLGNLNVREFM